MTSKPLYLDYHATTPLDPRVLEAMLPFFTERFGNPHSKQHAWGWEARDAVEAARGAGGGVNRRERRRDRLHERRHRIEQPRLARRRRPRMRIARGTSSPWRPSTSPFSTSVTDSSAMDVPSPCWASGTGGLLDLDALRRALRPETVLVSVMAANNEIGTLQPMAAIGAIVREHGALLHTDAAQAAGKIPIDVRAMNIDLLSLTGHKFYGPKGCGALFIRKSKPRLALTPQVAGGGQENGIRSGTLNVPGIVGLGQAAEICRLEMADESARLGALRDRLLAGLRSQLPGLRVNGTLEQRLPQNLHVSFDDNRRGSSSDGPRRSGRLYRLRVQFRQPGALARAAGHWRDVTGGRRLRSDSDSAVRRLRRRWISLSSASQPL